MKEHPKHLHKLHLGVILFFVALIIVFIISSIQNNNQDYTNLNKKQVPDIKKSTLTELRKEGYSLNEKPFENGNYEYDERTADFRLVCTSPCPVSKIILDQEFAAISYGVSTLRGLTQDDFNQDILPFEVHASEDARCPMNPQALAYMTTFTDSNGYRGLLCFFFDKLNYDRTKFPYSASVHEITHLFESGKIEHNSVIWEGLSEMLDSFFLRGSKNSFCWEHNAWFKQAAQNTNDPHWVGGDLFFELCNQYGFDYNDLPILFSEIKKRGGYVSVREFVNIINQITGKDTSELFRNAGIST